MTFLTPNSRPRHTQSVDPCGAGRPGPRPIEPFGPKKNQHLWNRPNRGVVVKLSGGDAASKVFPTPGHNARNRARGDLHKEGGGR
jgi:hypothetical protein